METSKTAAAILNFLDTEEISAVNVQRHLALKLKGLYGCETAIGFTCPLTDPTYPSLLLVYDSASDRIVVGTEAELKSAHPSAFHFTRLIDLPSFATDQHATPAILVGFAEDLPIDDATELSSLVREFARRAAESLFRHIRAEVIVAKVNSDDLGSFLHRLLREQGIRELLGYSHVSVFIRDWLGGVLKLRGTSSRLRPNIRTTDVVFDCTDTGKRLVGVHLTNQSLFEYSPSSDLKMDGLSHEQDRVGAWSRVYWPIRLSQRMQSKLRRSTSHPNDGVVRFTNATAIDGSKAPTTWFTSALCAFFCEALYNIADAFLAADEASFKKDEAFHNSMSVVDTIIRNLEAVQDSLYEPSREPRLNRPPRFKLTALNTNTFMPAERIFQLIRTAYASAKDISFQIGRANDEIIHDKHAVTEKIVKEVLLRAIELVPDMCVAHSVKQGSRVSSSVPLVSPTHLPPPVRGSAEALISVFANLFENSVKYRVPDRQVRIKLALDWDAHFVTVRVRDEGVGIPEGEEQRVFNRGFRGSNARDFSPRGSGLGLNWCERVLAAHGSTISAVRCEPGTEVIVKLARAE